MPNNVIIGFDNNKIFVHHIDMVAELYLSFGLEEHRYVTS